MYLKRSLICKDYKNYASEVANSDNGEDQGQIRSWSVTMMGEQHAPYIGRERQAITMTTDYFGVGRSIAKMARRSRCSLASRQNISRAPA